MLIEVTPYTKETGVAICRVRNGSRSQWRHVDTNDERHAYVGQAYGSRKALLVDHFDYLLRSGWLRRPEQDQLVIYSERRHNDSGDGFWSATSGWGSLDEATRFDAATGRTSKHLESDAQWVSVQDAPGLCPITCSECSEQTSFIIGCPDGAELCPSCFDEGSH